MAIAFQNASVGGIHGATSFSIAPPAGTVDGDFLVMGYVNNQASATPSVPGWNLGITVSDAVSDNLVRLYWKRASGEPASYTVSLGSTYGNEAEAAILRYRGVIASGNPIRTTGSALPSTLGDSKVGATLTGVEPADLAVHCAGTTLSTWNGADYTLVGPTTPWATRSARTNLAATATPGLALMDQVGSGSAPTVTATGAGAANVAWRFAAIVLIPEPEQVSLWSSSDTPAIASNNDPSAATLGVKFTSTTTGLVRGVRFYKGSLNTGTHTGSLWTVGGQLLATATFVNETASGWQQVNFSTPVQITAGTIYVASYHTTSGYYSVSRPYFVSPHVRGPLTALADEASGGNGLYGYSSTNTFPTGSFQSTNYWVDLIFEPTAGGVEIGWGPIPIF